MGGVGDLSWIDTLVEEFGFALEETIEKVDEFGFAYLTKAADETIQKSKELWKEFTKDIFDDESIQDSTGQLNNDKSGEELSSSLQKPVSDIKENPIQLEQEDENTVSQSSDELPEFDWGSLNSPWENDRNSFEEFNDSTFKLYKDIDMSSKEEESETIVSQPCQNMSELNHQHHHHNEEDRGLILKLRGDFEALNDCIVKSRGEDYDDEVKECNSEVMKEVLWKTRKCDSSRESLVVHDDEDDVSDKLEGFVDVMKEVEIANTTESSEDPECDWVFVTSD